MPATMNRARTRKPLPPATGRCRWVIQPTDGPTAHPGVLLINEAAYTVAPVKDGGRVVGYEMAKHGTPAVYHVPATFDACDCPDASWRHERAGGGCKHCQAMKAAVAALDG